MATAYHAKIKEKKELTKSVLTVRLEKPAGLTFTAGQYAVLDIPDLSPDDPRGTSRFFSIASTPAEKELLFVFRPGDSPFKQRLQSMPVGATIDIERLAGSLTLSPGGAAAVFFAGGIGITPLWSIIQEAAKNGFSLPIHLFYSNRSEGDAAFLEELQMLAKHNSNFKLVPTLTRLPSGHSWSGERGRITAQMIKKYLSVSNKQDFYIVGGHEFIDGIRKELLELGIAKESTRAEVFCGYCPEHTCCCSHIK